MSTSNRSCGGCTLCCKLLPVKEGADNELHDLVPLMLERGMITEVPPPDTMRDFDKPAGERCPHQQSGKGCKVYDRRPLACRYWHCAWLSNADTADMSRPDRSHYVINPVPDFVEANDERGHFKIPVIEIWCDPNFRDAWHDPALLAYLVRRARRDKYAALIRYNSHEGTFVAAPPLTNDGTWHIKNGNAGPDSKTHTFEEKLEALGGRMTIE